MTIKFGFEISIMYIKIGHILAYSTYFNDHPLHGKTSETI